MGTAPSTKFKVMQTPPGSTFSTPAREFSTPTARLKSPKVQPQTSGIFTTPATEAAVPPSIHGGLTGESPSKPLEKPAGQAGTAEAKEKPVKTAIPSPGSTSAKPAA